MIRCEPKARYLLCIYIYGCNQIETYGPQSILGHGCMQYLVAIVSDRVRYLDAYVFCGSHCQQRESESISPTIMPRFRIEPLLLTVTGTRVTPANAVVQLVSGPTEEFCETSLYCGFNISDVVGVQLQVNSSSGDWLTVYQFNNRSWSGQLAVSNSYAV